MPVTELKEVTFEEFLKMFDPIMHDRIKKSASDQKAEYVVCFQNLQMDSSNFGKRTMMVIGPACTSKTVDEIREGHLGQTPSTFQYPVAYAKVPGRCVMVAVPDGVEMGRLSSRRETEEQKVRGAIWLPSKDFTIKCKLCGNANTVLTITIFNKIAIRCLERECQHEERI